MLNQSEDQFHAIGVFVADARVMRLHGVCRVAMGKGMRMLLILLMSKMEVHGKGLYANHHQQDAEN